MIIIVGSVLQARNSHHFADPDLEERGLGIGAHSHFFKSTEVERSSVLKGWGMHDRMYLNPPSIFIRHYLTVNEWQGKLSLLYRAVPSCTFSWTYPQITVLVVHVLKSAALQCWLTPWNAGVSSKNVSLDPYYCHSRTLAVTLGEKCTCSPGVHGCTPDRKSVV